MPPDIGKRVKKEVEQWKNSHVAHYAYRFWSAPSCSFVLVQKTAPRFRSINFVWVIVGCQNTGSPSTHPRKLVRLDISIWDKTFDTPLKLWILTGAKSAVVPILNLVWLVKYEGHRLCSVTTMRRNNWKTAKHYRNARTGRDKVREG